ncbi:MAG: STAS domain-containing protein [Pseudomonadota bacterium]
MSISSDYDAANRTLKIQVSGRFDYSCHESFRSAYEEIGEPCDRFEIDLADADYLDSSALGMLLILRDHAGGDNANIEIQNCTPGVRKAFTISNFDRLFVIH